MKKILNEMIHHIKIITTGMVIGYILYRHMIISTVIGLFCSLVLYRFSSKENDRQLKHEFRVFLNSLYTELLVGQSMRNALIRTSQMTPLNNQMLSKGIQGLVAEIELGQSESRAWSHFAEVVPLESTRQFAEILALTYDLGGNIIPIVNESIKIMTDTLEVDLAIEVILSSKKFEFHLMMALPLLLLAALSASDYGYMSVLYETLGGRVVMTILLILMLLAYVIGNKITKLEG